ncbi:transglutaminase family protein [Tsukamurella spumae]|uniref:Transglutaminase family protein n=1 Tax=Tsukamurella spumae TaxID=44753 RepID=A0A846WYH8_9ACTN|nr:transglutaminase family protein [Tsukamurella spumae]NKY16840.1 transglutaminase family protein [Tsukamurella spumae]
MTIKVGLEHRTGYTFDRPVKVFPHVIRLRPAPHTRTPIEAYSLAIEPAEHFINWQQDIYGNYLARVVFPEPTSRLSFTVGLVADLASINPFDFFIDDSAEFAGFEYDEELRRDLEPYLRPVDDHTGEDGVGTGPAPLVTAFADRFRDPQDERMIDYLVRINRAVQEAVGYSVRMEAGVQTPEHTLRSAIGSCRDSAWLSVSVFRQLGIAARFVSGYLVQLASDVPALDGPSGPEADFTDLHAWAEVYLPGAGWVGLDATSGLFAGEGHIPLCATPSPGSAAPITGAVEPCLATMDFANVVSRIHEDPRVTLPYTPDQWQRVLDLGARVDAAMAEHDVRLTVGGEPTFVSIDDQTGAEWTTEADGAHKRVLASDLAARLYERYAPGGLVRRGQGKWYPGEPLPRWQIELMWRTDGRPLWRDPALLADPWNDREAAETSLEPYAPTGFARPRNARRTAAFLGAVADALRLPPELVLPAFEDPVAAYAAWLGKPAGDPPGAVGLEGDLDPETDGPDRRAALLARLEEGVNHATAQVLPISRNDADTGWVGNRWTVRRRRLVLVPGSSPAGLRLPLESLSWGEEPFEFEADPLRPAEPLPDGAVPRRRVVREEVETDEEGRPRWVPRTAIVAEVRYGVMHVFLPPTHAAEDFVELIAVIEHAARECGEPVVIEGYGPPADGRLSAVTVTPDPGVIEVNVQPTSSFAEQHEVLSGLYEDARQARLGTETFDVDGTHGGTGGGNHLTLGGPTPADSPLLRRPDLLVSLLTYWQRHPSLSYLFSGRFIGTTSQAPRVDEGRESALYELEIAFAEIDRLTRGDDARWPVADGGDDEYSPPWVADRALRHLLTDITGNTHRAEFCIDKLYSPDSPRGRLGLLELRGFEMPPHVQMALVQSLLVRCLVDRFWRVPYREPLIRHGANLHGKWLLPYFIEEDIARVVADLRESGAEFELSWLAPFTEFRFPRLGTVHVGPVELELRGAIEPWNVLGEEATAGGTARYVDSSIERVQVTARGLDPQRYLLTCNGHPVPLVATDRPDLRVAGIRFRAWQPPSALHPTITVDSPLVFDLVDLAAGRSIGGATYHVVHPGGRAFDTPPVNSVAAESRRGARFERLGHTAGPIAIAALRERIARAATDVGAPGILDLRRARTVLG